jgi:HSP20 family protein
LAPCLQLDFFKAKLSNQEVDSTMKFIKQDNQVQPYVSPFDVFDRLNWGFPLNRIFSDVDNEQAGASSTRVPRTNVQETDNAYVVELEMPGLSRDEVEVSYENDTLIVRGEKINKTEQKDEGKGVVRREYHSRFERTFTVHGIDSEGISAKMENGILFVTLPKSRERMGRKISVS